MGKGLGCLVPLAAIGALGLGTAFGTAYSGNPFCTYDLIYRLDVTIEVDGQPYSSVVTRLNSVSRRWLGGLFHLGCPPTHGTALSYRLPDNRAVLIGSSICWRAREAFLELPNQYPPDFTRAMSEGRQIDPMKLCRGRLTDQPGTDGFVLNDADRPTKWEPFRFGTELITGPTVIRLVSASAKATTAPPADDLDQAAPGVATTHFEYREWSNSPEAIISFERRLKSANRTASPPSVPAVDIITAPPASSQ